MSDGNHHSNSHTVASEMTGPTPPPPPLRGVQILTTVTCHRQVAMKEKLLWRVRNFIVDSALILELCGLSFHLQQHVMLCVPLLYRCTCNAKDHRNR